MVLERLELTDFRNYETLRLSPSGSLCLFTGDNGQGKTNILEAIVVLALGRSPRTARDADLVRWGAGEAVIRAEVRRQAREPVTVALAVAADGTKRYRVDGVPCRRLLDAVGEINAVMFGPDDLRLVNGSPEERRRYLNTCLGQTNPRYLEALSAYRGVLRQRNRLLKQAVGGRIDEELLRVYDDQLAGHAGTLMMARRERVAGLAAEASAVHARLSGGRERLLVRYVPDVPLPGEADEAALGGAMLEHLIARRDVERRRGVTACGPHRDELAIELDGTPARAFGSQGQQRTAALALKIAELRVIAAAVGEPPLLLLDDVTSELDEGRRTAVLALTEEADQVLVTASHESVFPPSVLARAAWYRVAGGRVEPVTGN